MTLRERAITGIRWSATAHGAQHLVQLVTTLVLVALLDPADFGLLGMATVFTALARVVHELGTATAIVQRDTVSDVLLSSVFWTNLALGLVTAVTLVACAPLAAVLYGDARVEPILAALAIVFAISGTSIVHGAVLQRALAFRTLATIEITAVGVSCAVALAIAANGGGVWSLVGQVIAAAVMKSAGLWIACAWRPCFRFSWTELRGVLGFSLHLTGFSVFNHFARHVDYLLIGRFLGATELGYYTLACRLMLYPVQNVSTVVNRVTLPVYARLQHDDRRLRSAFLRVSAVVATVTAPIMIGLTVVSDVMVSSVFGARWEPAAVIIAILAPVGLAQSLANPLGNIYKTKGRTGLLFAWGVLMGLIVAGAVVAGLPFGVKGVAIAYAAVSLAMFCPSCAIPFRLIGLGVPVFLARLRRPLACALAMGVAVLAIRALVPPTWSPTSTLVLLIAGGVTAYALLSLSFNRQQLREVVHIAGMRPA